MHISVRRLYTAAVSKEMQAERVHVIAASNHQNVYASICTDVTT